MKVKVISVFQDKFTWKRYEVGDVIEIDDEARAEDLISRQLVECIEGEKREEKKPAGITLFEKEFEKKVLVDTLKSVGAKATGNMSESTLLGLVSELDEETTAKLKEALGIE